MNGPPPQTGARRTWRLRNQGPFLPDWLAKWGGRAWMVVGIAASLVVVWLALSTIRVVTVPLTLSAFPAAILLGPARWLRGRGIRRSLAALLTLVVASGLLGGAVAMVAVPLVEGMSELGDEVGAAYADVRAWLADGPLDVTEEDIDGHVQGLLGVVEADGQRGLLGRALTLVEIAVGVATLFVVLFFVLKDADHVCDEVLERLPDRRRRAVGRALSAARGTLARYTGGLALVGAFDAIFIGLGIHLLGIPLALPIATVVFFGSFFPLVGAWVAGLVGVAVAFGHGGVRAALLVLAVITIVEQIEANVIAPVVFRQTLQLHPVVTVIAILAGGAAFGILGAFLAVPLIAVGVAVHRAVHPDPDSSMVSLVRVG